MLRQAGPQPYGLLHLGNAWAFLLAWLAARAQGGRLLLRLEDIAPPAFPAELAAAALEDLRWLGLDWDAGPDLGGPHAPYVQSLRTDLYAAALARLEAQGLTYPCFCSRRELRHWRQPPTWTIAARRTPARADV